MAIGDRRKTARSSKHFSQLKWGAINVRTLHTKINNQGGELQIDGATPDKPYEICTVIEQHRISLAAMSEVRCKCSGGIRIGDHLCLFSGPPHEAPVSLSGVAFLLNKDMQRAWEKAGSEVEYVNERLMRITVLLEDRLFQVISVYAPTFRASEQEKESFYAPGSVQKTTVRGAVSRPGRL